MVSDGSTKFLVLSHPGMGALEFEEKTTLFCYAFDDWLSVPKKKAWHR